MSVLIISAVGIAVVCFSKQCVQVFVPGFSEDKKEQMSLILKYLSPALIFMSLSMVTYSILNAHRKFMKAAVPESVYKILVLIGFLVVIPLLDLKAVPVVLSLASLVLFISMLIWVPENQSLFRWDWADSTQLRQVFRLMGPIAIGVIFSHISGLVDNMLASTLPTGHLSYLGYSKKMIDALLLIGPVALVTVSYAQLANLWHESPAKYRELFVKVLRVLIYMGIPGTCLIVLLREPMIEILFERGKFDADSAAGTAGGLLIYGLGFLFFAVQSHFVYSFYALSDTKTPVSVGVGCVILDIILAVSFIRILGFMGIALAFVISKSIKVFILGYLLERRLKFIRDSGLPAFLVKTLVAALPATLMLLYLSGINGTEGFIAKSVIDLILPSLGFLAVFAFFSVLFRIEEAGFLKDILLARFAIKKAA
jgi:putative peptidoglycan lipid II flippase